MHIEVYRILPHMGALKRRILEFEQEVKRDFGTHLKLTVQEIDMVYGIDLIVKTISDMLSVPLHDILSNQRQAHSREARQIAMFLCKKYLPHAKDKEIAHYFSRDRSNVIRSVKRIEDLLAAADAVTTHNVKLCDTRLIEVVQSSFPDKHD